MKRWGIAITVLSIIGLIGQHLGGGINVFSISFLPWGLVLIYEGSVRTEKIKKQEQINNAALFVIGSLFTFSLYLVCLQQLAQSERLYTV